MPWRLPAFEAALTVRLMIKGRKQQSASNPRTGDRPRLILGVCTSDGSPASFEAVVHAVWTGEATAADFEVSAEVTYLREADNLTCSEGEDTDRSPTLNVPNGRDGG